MKKGTVEYRTFFWELRSKICKHCEKQILTFTIHSKLNFLNEKFLTFDSSEMGLENLYQVVPKPKYGFLRQTKFLVTHSKKILKFDWNTFFYGKLSQKPFPTAGANANLHRSANAPQEGVRRRPRLGGRSALHLALLARSSGQGRTPDQHAGSLVVTLTPPRTNVHATSSAVRQLWTVPSSVGSRSDRLAVAGNDFFFNSATPRLSFELPQIDDFSDKVGPFFWSLVLERFST